MIHLLSALCRKADMPWGRRPDADAQDMRSRRLPMILFDPLASLVLTVSGPLTPSRTQAQPAAYFQTRLAALIDAWARD